MMHILVLAPTNTIAVNCLVSSKFHSFQTTVRKAFTMVRNAIEKGKYGQLAAINGLIWILIDKGKAMEAFALSDSMLQIHPGSRFFLWGAAEAAVKMKNPALAKKYYQKILASLLQDGNLTPYLEGVCRSKIANEELKAGQTQAGCSELITAISQAEISNHPRKKELKGKLDKLWQHCKDVPVTSNERASSR